MSTYANYRDYSFSLLAGQPRRVSASGDYWQIITAAAAVMLTFDDQVPITRFQGMGGPATYQAVTLVSDVDQNVVVSLGRTDGRLPYDSRATGAGSGVADSVRSNVSVGIVDFDDITCPSGAATLLLAGNATRLRYVVRIADSAGAGLRIGGSSVGATRGTPVYAGDTISDEVSADVYLYNGSGAAVTVSRQEFLA